MGKKALITGATGFVGRYLIDKLYSEDYEIYGTTLSGDLYDDPRITMFYLDLTDYVSTSKLINQIKPDEVYHLASQSSVKLSWEKPQLTTEVNIIGTINLLESVKEYIPETRVLLIGSSEEYGQTFKHSKQPNEDEKCMPENIYAITKHTQNMIGKMYVKAYNLNVIMTRSFNHVGPKQSPQFVISDFCKQVAEIELLGNKPVIYVGNLESSRDFLDVRDVVNAYFELLKSGTVGEIYNVGSGHSVRISDLLERIISNSSVNISVETDPLKFRPIEIEETIADITKLQNDTKWHQLYDLDDTILITLNYWRDRVKEKQSKLNKRKSL